MKNILSTFVFGVIVLILLLGNVFGFGITGKTISETKAGDEVVSFLNEYLVEGGATLKTIEKNTELGVYVVSIDYKDNTIPMYLSIDGKYLDWGAGMVNVDAYIKSLSSQSPGTEVTPKDVPKTDKPSVELYVFTYCPYGLQMEKAMIPVVKLLKDKINFKIRQIGAMHGEYEKIEAERQLCIEKNYPDKFLDYVLAFAEDTAIGSCSGDATCLNSKLSALYSKLGIDASKVNSCMTSEGEKLYNAEVSNANSKGISGSPTLLINSVNSQAGRSPSGVLTSVCSAFNNVPSECSQTLSTSQVSAGFGSGTSSSSSAVQCAT